MDGHDEQTAADPEGVSTGPASPHSLPQQAAEGIVSVSGVGLTRWRALTPRAM